MIINKKYYETVEIVKPDSTSNVLFIHGFTSNFNKHLFLKDYLPDDVSFYALNLPAAGHTPAYIRTWNSRENYAKILAGYIKKLNLKNIIVIAHSMGASIAAFLSDLMPNNIIGYILESPENVTILENTKIIINKHDDSLKEKLHKIKNFLDSAEHHDEQRVKRKIEMYIKKIIKHPAIFKVYYDLGIKKYIEKSVTKTNPIFAKLQRPTLIMFGELDNIVLYDLSIKNFHSLENEALELITIEDAGHSIYADQKEIYLNHILKFIKENNFTRTKIRPITFY